MTYSAHKNTMHKSAHSFSRRILFAAVGLFCTQSAFSDATVVYEQNSGSQKSLNSMQIKDGKIRFSPPGQNTNYSLYDSKTGELTHVEVAQKKYLVMNENDIKNQAAEAKKQMDAMRQQMVDRMADMPPEQKKQVEQMMENHLARVEAQKNPPKVEQKKTSRTETINGIQCTVHESYIEGVKNNELCITAPDKMGLNGQDAETLMAMQAFMKRMQKVAQTMMGGNAAGPEVQGIPLHTKFFAPDGTVKLETRMNSISTDAVSSEKISIPAGFTTMQMPASPKMK